MKGCMETHYRRNFCISWKQFEFSYPKQDPWINSPQCNSMTIIFLINCKYKLVFLKELLFPTYLEFFSGITFQRFVQKANIILSGFVSLSQRRNTFLGLSNRNWRINSILKYTQTSSARATRRQEPALQWTTFCSKSSIWDIWEFIACNTFSVLVGSLLCTCDGWASGLVSSFKRQASEPSHQLQAEWGLIWEGGHHDAAALTYLQSSPW